MVFLIGETSVRAKGLLFTSGRPSAFESYVAMLYVQKSRPGDHRLSDPIGCLCDTIFRTPNRSRNKRCLVWFALITCGHGVLSDKRFFTGSMTLWLLSIYARKAAVLW